MSIFNVAITVFSLLALTACGSSSKPSSSETMSSDDSDTSLNDDGDAAVSVTTACQTLPSYTGHATYYDATGTGTCLLQELQPTAMIAALNETDFSSAAWCGACAKVTGPKGVVTVKIVDMCPTCSAGDLDLSPAAFAAIAEPIDGVADINWEFVPCETAGNIQLHYKEGSSAYWTAVQIRNHRYPIASAEYLDDSGQYQPLNREQYNFFIHWSGLGEPPYTFRFKDFNGQEIIQRDVGLLLDTAIDGSAQFPYCAE